MLDMRCKAQMPRRIGHLVALDCSQVDQRTSTEAIAGIIQTLSKNTQTRLPIPIR